MSGNLMLGPNCTMDLMKMVRSSLETVRNLLAEGTPTEETIDELQQLEQLEHLLLDQAARLDAINRVLEEFNYSVAHELFAPLRRISGFTRELKARSAREMGPDGIDCLNNILDSTQQMNDLIDALMQLSRLSHVELQPVVVDLSELAKGISRELTLSAPLRRAVFSIAPNLSAAGDAAMLKTALGKMFENAWKYTARVESALIEFGGFAANCGQGFYLRDNGVGFDMAECGRLFHPFQRLHDPEIYPGNGIGLTAVKRIIDRHGGSIWAEGARDQGATFFFTL